MMIPDYSPFLKLTQKKITWKVFCLTGPLWGESVTHSLSILMPWHLDTCIWTFLPQRSPVLTLIFSDTRKINHRVYLVASNSMLLNTLRERQHGRRFADTFKLILLSDNFRIAIKISPKFVPKGPINNNPALVQIMARDQPGTKPLSAPAMVRLLMHICITWPLELILCHYSQ